MLYDIRALKYLFVDGVSIQKNNVLGHFKPEFVSLHHSDRCRKILLHQR